MKILRRSLGSRAVISLRHLSKGLTNGNPSGCQWRRITSLIVRHLPCIAAQELNVLSSVDENLLAELCIRTLASNTPEVNEMQYSIDRTRLIGWYRPAYFGKLYESTCTSWARWIPDLYALVLGKFRTSYISCSAIINFTCETTFLKSLSCTYTFSFPPIGWTY